MYFLPAGEIGSCPSDSQICVSIASREGWDSLPFAYTVSCRESKVWEGESFRCPWRAHSSKDCILGMHLPAWDNCVKYKQIFLNSNFQSAADLSKLQRKRSYDCFFIVTAWWWDRNFKLQFRVVFPKLGCLSGPSWELNTSTESQALPYWTIDSSLALQVITHTKVSESMAETNVKYFSWTYPHLLKADWSHRLLAPFVLFRAELSICQTSLLLVSP